MVDLFLWTLIESLIIIVAVYLGFRAWNSFWGTASALRGIEEIWPKNVKYSISDGQQSLLCVHKPTDDKNELVLIACRGVLVQREQKRQGQSCRGIKHPAGPIWSPEGPWAHCNPQPPVLSFSSSSVCIDLFIYIFIDLFVYHGHSRF